jgi:hypothetical protein
MKTPEEIQKIAEKEMMGMEGRFGFEAGYEKCQEDNADKKYTEADVIKLMSMATKWDTFKDGDVEYEMDMDNFFKYLIDSLNKQDNE